MFKRGEKLVAKVHRCEHSSDFRAYAIAINPTFEMSSERSTSMRQVTTSRLSRQRTSRGEVQYMYRLFMSVLLNLLVTLKAAPHECLNWTGLL